MLYQDNIPEMIILQILIACLLDNVLKLQRQFTYGSLLGVKGLNKDDIPATCLTFLEPLYAMLACYPSLV